MRSLNSISTRKMPSENRKEDLGVSQDMEGPGSSDWDRQGGEIRGQGLSRKETRAREERHAERRGLGERGTTRSEREGETLTVTEGRKASSDLDYSAVTVLTRGAPSDHKKSPSMVLSLSPIHWYSRYRSGEKSQRCSEQEAPYFWAVMTFWGVHPKTFSPDFAGLWLLAQKQAPLLGKQPRMNHVLPPFLSFFFPPPGKKIRFTILKALPRFFSFENF